MAIDNYEYALVELEKLKGKWPKIAEECDVSYSWLCKFANNEIPDASHRKVVRLVEILRSMNRRRPRSGR